MFFKFSNRRYFFSLAICACLTLANCNQSLEAHKPYRVDFRGVENWLQVRSLKDSSNLIRYKKNAPRSVAALQHRANSDVSPFIDVMHAYGYYDACVTNQTFRLPNGKYKIVVNIDKGARYKLTEFNVSVKDPNLENTIPLKKTHLRDFDIRLKRPALATTITESKKKILDAFRAKGYPLAEIAEETIEVDQAQKSVFVDYQVESGPRANFGTIYLEADSKIKSQYIRNRIVWKTGELYNVNDLKRTEKALYNTGLFSVVSISPGNEVDENHDIPISISLIDAKYNGFTLGGSYTTTWEGLGGQAAWQMRNLLASGTNFEINYQVNQKLQEAGIKYSVPDFISKHQVFVVSSSVANNKQPNYTEKIVKTDLYVERRLSAYFKTSLGARFDQLETLRSDNNGFFSLFGIPFHFNTQSSENVLINPTQGGWANVSLTPYFSLKRNDGNFTEVRFEGSVYQYLIPSRRIVLAMSMVFGSLFGESNFDIPTPYRFFAGSPNHLRGYPYQSISPLDARNRPIGGRSEFLWSIEPRFMLFKSFGLVGFFDVGNVYTTTWPKWRRGFFKSLGVGARYFSFVGPLRLDIGFPLNKPPNVRRNYEIYFSFGQAF